MIEQLAQRVLDEYNEIEPGTDDDALYFILDEVCADNSLNEQEFDELCQEVYAKV